MLDVKTKTTMLPLSGAAFLVGCISIALAIHAGIGAVLVLLMCVTTMLCLAVAFVAMFTNDDHTVTPHAETAHGAPPNPIPLPGRDEVRDGAQRLESLRLLAAGVVHDFNNLLFVVLSSADIITRRSSDPDVRKIADNAKRAAERATELAKQLLFFTKESGDTQGPTEDLRATIEESVELTLGGNSTAKAYLTVDKKLYHVDIDPMSVMRIVQNLLINAREAMPSGGRVFVDASNVTETEAGGCMKRFVRLLFSDEGSGIPEEIIPHIFKPRFTTKKERGGSGLGLASVASIVERHGGSISVRSRVGEGAAFEILLPAHEEESVPGIEHRQSTRDTSKLHVLVLDDDHAILDTLGLMLNTLGHETTLAVDSAFAVREFEAREKKKDRFDLVILDRAIPGEGGGIETLRTLRKMRKDLPAIVSSASPLAETEQGFTFLKKPYSIGELDDAIREAS